MSNHTPGPWFVIDSHYPSFKEINGPSFSIKCVMLATNLTDGDYQIRKADLNLISAAPELLDALERIINDDRVAVDKNDYLFAKKAIAKARGERDE